MNKLFTDGKFKHQEVIRQKTAKKLIEAEESMKPMTIIQSILAECNKRINQTDENLYLQQ